MDFLQSISIIIAAWTAIYGISAWRREYVGKRRIDLAEDVLALSYEARDVISAIRSPLGWEGEGTSRKPRDDETPEEKKIKDQAYVVVERYEKRQELFNKLHAMRYRFMAVFGQERSTPFDDLWKVTRDIMLAARSLGWLWLRQERARMSDQELERHRNKVEEAEAIFWEGADPDPIAPRVDAIIKEFEETCGAVILQRNTLGHWVERIKKWLRRQPD